MVVLVGWPAGTMTHTARGASSFATRPSRESAVSAPWEATSARASVERSKATTSWPFSTSRADMLAPIFPSPTMPIFMPRSFPFSGDLGQLVDGHPDHAPAVGQQAPVVAGGLGGDEGPEVEVLAGDGDLGARCPRHDLDGHHRVGAALVELARG